MQYHVKHLYECDVDFCCRIIVFASIENERVTSPDLQPIKTTEIRSSVSRIFVE